MTTLAVLTSTLEDLCDEIENQEEIPQQLLERFVDASLQHSKKVGAYIGALQSLKKNAAYYSERAEIMTRRAKTCERLEAAIKDRLMAHIKTSPDLPWKSEEGDKLALRDNPEKLVVDVKLDRRHLNNLLWDHTKIPTEFLIVSTFYTLNTEAVKLTLKAGTSLEWARLERGQHLRVY